jgi:dTMP kinase
MSTDIKTDAPKKAYYICFEGTEGVGKTTQTQKLVDYLTGQGFKVLQTKEPGTPHLPITMELRKIMLDKQFDSSLTPIAREYISQAIRSIHMDKLVVPSLCDYDFIIQDRGVLSGFAYGSACGNDVNMLTALCHNIGGDRYSIGKLYDKIIYLRGDVKKGLNVAKTSKQEFKDGDAMEAKGDNFMLQVQANMDTMSTNYSTSTIDVGDKDIDTVFNEILSVIEIK